MHFRGVLWRCVDLISATKTELRSRLISADCGIVQYTTTSNYERHIKSAYVSDTLPYMSFFIISCVTHALKS